MARSGLLAGLFGLAVVISRAAELPSYCPVFYAEPPADCEPIPDTLFGPAVDNFGHREPDIGILEDTFDALADLQGNYFDVHDGTWLSAIDWTAAVVETVVAGTLTTLSRSLGRADPGNFKDWKAKENLVSFFFSQVTRSYYGQNATAMRDQAYDDMQWVVLGWIEAIRFVSVHSTLHYPVNSDDNAAGASRLELVLDGLPWHGNNWISPFAHRALVFWHLASRGWDEELCHGGMIWSPHVTPYKNAITNELWIAASISMYRYFPGANFTAPSLGSDDFPERDPTFKAAAIEGYEWLMGINMTNSQGLFVDGYHVNSEIPGNVECDIRDEMVYTYNQGVILTGQRGLWAASGIPLYMKEGHDLVRSVINATGWNLMSNSPVDDIIPGQLPPWHGIGRGGILEDECDASGECSQDVQTFKGIFFHHLTAFCEPLESSDEVGVTVNTDGFRRVRRAHAKACRSYVGWVQHNAEAALETRDSHGRFGMWWGAGLFGNVTVSRSKDGIDHSAANTTDYRNQGTPDDDIWGGSWVPGSGGASRRGSDGESLPYPDVGGDLRRRPLGIKAAAGHPRRAVGDPNDRGRGRTVETQNGGLALLRAYWEMSQPK